MLTSESNPLTNQVEQMLGAMKVPHVVLTAIFNRDVDEKEHDEQLEVASKIVENFPDTIVICWNKHVLRDIPFQKRCKAFGIEPACRSQSLWKLLGVKEAPLARKKSAPPVAPVLPHVIPTPSAASNQTPNAEGNPATTAAQGSAATGTGEGAIPDSLSPRESSVPEEEEEDEHEHEPEPEPEPEPAAAVSSPKGTRDEGGRDKEREKDRERDREHRDKDREKEREHRDRKDRDREKDREHRDGRKEKRDRDRDRDREHSTRDKDKDRERRESSRSSRDKDKEKDQHRDRHKERSSSSTKTRSSDRKSKK